MNIHVWDLRRLYRSFDKSSSQVLHLLSDTTQAFESPDPIKKHDRLDSRVLVESTSWSPFGLGRSGSSLFAKATRSDGSLHIRVLEPVRTGFGINLHDRWDITGAMREQWMRIPSFATDGSRLPITHHYPSSSYLLDKPDRCSLTWSPTVVKGKGFLITAWNNISLVWSLASSEPPVALGALIHSSSDSVSRISLSSALSVGPDAIALSSKSQQVSGATISWQLIIGDLNSPYIHSVSAQIVKSPYPAQFTLAKPLHHKSYFSDSMKGGVLLAACSSPNDAVDFVARKTSRSVQVFYAVSEAMRSMESSISGLLKAAQETHSPLIDLASAVSSQFVPSKSDKVTPMSTESPLNSIIRRFLPESSLDCGGQLGTQLAFGLHHLHSSIDPAAASGPRARQAERRLLLELLGVPFDAAIVCPTCGDQISGVADSAKSITCKQGHAFLVCAASRIAINEVDAIECCFCGSVMSRDRSKKALSLCRLCRIGVTAPL